MSFISGIARSAESLLVNFTRPQIRHPQFEQRALLCGTMPLCLRQLQCAYDESAHASTEEDLCHEESWLDTVAQRAATDTRVVYRGVSINPRTDDGHEWRIAFLFNLRGTRMVVLLPKRDKHGQSDRCAAAYVENGTAVTMPLYTALIDVFTRRLRGSTAHVI